MLETALERKAEGHALGRMDDAKDYGRGLL